jgi:hypothetical protein
MIRVPREGGDLHRFKVMEPEHAEALAIVRGLFAFRALQND